jgi:hypothetical protein
MSGLGGGFNRSTQHPSNLTRCNGMHMEGQARTWLTPKQRAELWERWKSGQFVADVAPSGGNKSGVYRICSSATPESSGERCCRDRLNPQP